MKFNEDSRVKIPSILHLTRLGYDYLPLKDAEWNFTCDFEYTVPGTPQQNSLVEVSFSHLVGFVRTMANAAYIPIEMRYRLSKYLNGMATKLDWLVPVKIDEITKPRIMHYQDKMPGFKYLRAFGKTAIVNIGKDGKIGNRGRNNCVKGLRAGRGVLKSKCWQRHA